jgi:pyrrolidone-carboxylate peptidase
LNNVIRVLLAVPTMHRILIYGFGPYQHYASNITEVTLRDMKLPRNMFKRVFDVRFDRQMFENVFETVQPDVILGLGQHPRARKLRIERRSHNRGRSTQTRFATLSLPQTSETTVAHDAGDYVCNYSMWVGIEWCMRNNARYGFLHVPKDYSPKKLARYVSRAITSC